MATDPLALADRWHAAIKRRWPDLATEIVLPTFGDQATLARWHPDLDLAVHRGAVDRLAFLLAIDGVTVLRQRVTPAAYDRWRGKRPDTRANRARFIGELGAVRPWRLGLHIAKPKEGEAGIGWCALELDGRRPAGAGVMKIE